MSPVKSSVAVMIRPPRIRSAMGCRFSRQLPHHVVVRFRPPVAEKLPGAPHLLDHVEVHLADDQLVLVLAALCQEVAARIHEVTRAVELPDVPWCFGADAIDAAHEVAIGYGVRG